MPKNGKIDDKKDGEQKFFYLCSIASLLLFVSLVFNVILIVNKPIIKYENDENIIFFGDSITHGYDLDRFYPNNNVINKGIGGNRTGDLLDRVRKDVYEHNPSKVFLLIGINDLCGELDQEDIVFNIQSLINEIKQNRSKTEIYVESVYPVNPKIIKDKDVKFALPLNNKKVMNLNKAIKEVCEEEKVTYIDLYDKLLDKEGNLKNLYTNDGLHLNNLGYLKVTSVLKEYVD
jgi:lysophospholipase L1-like esterase